MNIKRMLKLADVLNEVDPNHFYINDWFFELEEGRSIADTDTGDIFELEDAQVDPVLDPKGLCKHTCNTVACALGWAASIPEFRRAGLVIKDKTPTILDAKGHVQAEGFRAGSIFFDLAYDLAQEIFSEDGYPEFVDSGETITPKVVSKRIHQEIKNFIRNQKNFVKSLRKQSKEYIKLADKLEKEVANVKE